MIVYFVSVSLLCKGYNVAMQYIRAMLNAHNREVRLKSHQMLHNKKHKFFYFVVSAISTDICWPINLRIKKKQRGNKCLIVFDIQMPIRQVTLINRHKILSVKCLEYAG